MANLSLKGIVSLSHQIIKDGKTNTHNIELFQDDFEDCVMLTVEEAKALLRRIPEFKENGDWQLPIERLKERIAKVEGKL